MALQTTTISARLMPFGAPSTPSAKYYNVDLSETSWRDLGVHPQGHRKEAAAKGVATKRERGELKHAAAEGAATRKREHKDRED